VIPRMAGRDLHNSRVCSGGHVVDFANGVGTGNLTLFDAQSTTLAAADVASTTTGSTTFSLAPGVLHSQTVAPTTSDPVAGTPFAGNLSAFDEYGTSTRTTPAHSA
jgi:hypothetical protein